MAGHFRKKGKPKKSQSDDPSWDCAICDAQRSEMIKCDICEQWMCYECQEITQDIIKIIERYDKVGIRWFCTKCRNGDVCDSISGNIVHKLARLTEDCLAKTANTVDEVKALSAKVDVLLDDRREHAQLMADVKSEVKTQCETVKKTFAQALNVPPGKQATAVPDLRGIMREALTEQKQQSEDTERRAKNIIVYGIKELATDTEKAQTDATTSAFINDLCDYLECQVGHTQYRLGRRDENATSHQRPIKVIFNAVTDKDKVMLSLRKLRDAPEYLRAARISDDLSQEERELVRAKVAEARLLSQNEPDAKFIHVVRGSPKNGLRIDRVMKRRGAEQ